LLALLAVEECETAEKASFQMRTGVPPMERLEPDKAARVPPPRGCVNDVVAQIF
jgi:hypothetical protein